MLIIIHPRHSNQSWRQQRQKDKENSWRVSPLVKQTHFPCQVEGQISKASKTPCHSTWNISIFLPTAYRATCDLIPTKFISTCDVRYVGILRFIFHVLQLLPIRITQLNMCCIRKFNDEASTKNRIENQTSLNLAMVIGSVCLSNS